MNKHDNLHQTYTAIRSPEPFKIVLRVHISSHDEGTELLTAANFIAIYFLFFTYSSRSVAISLPHPSHTLKDMTEIRRHSMTS